MIDYNDAYISGHCYAHYMCALWSSSVELTHDDTITHVDLAVVAGASQRCAQCKKVGATLSCKVSINTYILVLMFEILI